MRTTDAIIIVAVVLQQLCISSSSSSSSLTGSGCKLSHLSQNVSLINCSKIDKNGNFDALRLANMQLRSQLKIILPKRVKNFLNSASVQLLDLSQNSELQNVTIDCNCSALQIKELLVTGTKILQGNQLLTPRRTVVPKLIVGNVPIIDFKSVQNFVKVHQVAHLSLSNTKLLNFKGNFTQMETNDCQSIGLVTLKIVNASLTRIHSESRVYAEKFLNFSSNSIKSIVNVTFRSAVIDLSNNGLEWINDETQFLRGVSCNYESNDQPTLLLTNNSLTSSADSLDFLSDAHLKGIDLSQNQRILQNISEEQLEQQRNLQRQQQPARVSEFLNLRGISAGKYLSHLPYLLRRFHPSAAALLLDLADNGIVSDKELGGAIKAASAFADIQRLDLSGNSFSSVDIRRIGLRNLRQLNLQRMPSLGNVSGLADTQRVHNLTFAGNMLDLTCIEGVDILLDQSQLPVACCLDEDSSVVTCRLATSEINSASCFDLTGASTSASSSSTISQNLLSAAELLQLNIQRMPAVFAASVVAVCVVAAVIVSCALILCLRRHTGSYSTAASANAAAHFYSCGFYKLKIKHYYSHQQHSHDYHLHNHHLRQNQQLLPMKMGETPQQKQEQQQNSQVKLKNIKPLAFV